MCLFIATAPRNASVTNNEMQMCLLIAVCLVLSITAAQEPTKSPCTMKQSCHECIQTPTCAWCYQPDYKGKVRCFQKETDLTSHCVQEYVYKPTSEYTHKLNKPIRKALSSSDEAIQISPQRVSLKLRINEAYRVNFVFAQAEDYPVDLYYLMDLSKSMEDDKATLSSLGEKLALRMQNITSNFRLGFGSFIDKIILPFGSAERLMEVCTTCSVPYNFYNNMKLSIDTSNFALEVSRSNISGNYDGPEGGFDAIMQAIVCQKEIGWRTKARKLLVLSTDSTFHYAGDGRLAGIVKPNDGLCHLENGEYSYSRLQDYPSISQMNFIAKKYAVNIIFAVPKKWSLLYKELSKNIEGSYTGVLSSDSTNIIELIQHQYEQITSSVEISDNAPPGIVTVTYYTSCLDNTVTKGNKCRGLRVGDKVAFIAEIVVKACPQNRKEWKQTFHIYPVGLNESLIIDLEVLCDCPCEHNGHPNASQCSGSGTFKCGICECDDSHFGESCECGSDNIQRMVGENNSTDCKLDNTTVAVCSGRGTCVCGKCVCDKLENPEERIYGQFCECDNFSCSRFGGLLCAGSDHGTCVCGKCICNSGWTGSACDCRVSTDSCISPGGGEICSGHGDCECGACKCNENEKNMRFGHYCEICPTCASRCEELMHCVECQVYKTADPLAKPECTTNCTFVPIVVDTIQETENNKETLCASYDEDNCRFLYVYSYDTESKIVVRAQQKKECPEKVNILPIVLGVTSAIVLIGLGLLILWKVITTIHDSREYAKFENERKSAIHNENPLYKGAITETTNPLYGKLE